MRTVFRPSALKFFFWIVTIGFFVASKPCTAQKASAPSVKTSTTSTSAPDPVATPSDAVKPNSDPGGINSRLSGVEQRVAQQESRIQELEVNERAASGNWAWVLFIVGGVGLLSVTHVWRYIRRALLDPKIQDAARESLASAVTQMRAELLERTESELIRFARILALVDAEQFDAALDAYGWTGDIAVLRTEHVVLRRAIIKALFSSLGRSEHDRKSNEDQAWRSVQELIEGKPDAPDLRIYLTIALRLRRYTDAVKIVDQRSEQLRTDLECATRAASILRRVGRLADAVKLLEALPPSPSAATLVTQAAINRDYGKFDEAHSLLLPAVQKIIDLQPERLEEDDARVVNTFVANCYDRGCPEDGLAAATLILERLALARPIEIATTGRLLVKLNEESPISPALREAFQRRVGQLPKTDVKVHCMFYWHQLNGEAEEGERLLADELAETEARIASPGASGDSDLQTSYYLRCLLGGAMLRRGAANEASNLLVPATKGGYSGEAYFLLAKCELKRGDAQGASQWLAQAVKMLPRWRQAAFDDAALSKDPVVMAGLKSG